MIVKIEFKELKNVCVYQTTNKECMCEIPKYYNELVKCCKRNCQIIIKEK